MSITFASILVWYFTLSNSKKETQIRTLQNLTQNVKSRKKCKHLILSDAVTIQLVGSLRFVKSNKRSMIFLHCPSNSLRDCWRNFWVTQLSLRLLHLLVHTYSKAFRKWCLSLFPSFCPSIYSSTHLIIHLICLSISWTGVCRVSRELSSSFLSGFPIVTDLLQRVSNHLVPCLPEVKRISLAILSCDIVITCIDIIKSCDFLMPWSNSSTWRGTLSSDFRLESRR